MAFYNCSCLELLNSHLRLATQHSYHPRTVVLKQPLAAFEGHVSDVAGGLAKVERPDHAMRDGVVET